MHNKHTGHTYVLEYTYNFTRTIYRIEDCLLELNLLKKKYSCITWSYAGYIYLFGAGKNLSIFFTWQMDIDLLISNLII